MLIKSKFNFRGLFGSILTNLKFNRKFKIYISDNKNILFKSSNYVTKFRYDTFFEKEPETLAWIDGMQADSVLWDIGANIGLYTIYFLVMNKGSAVAFEPHPSNLSGLAENLLINNLLNEKITIVPTPLYSKMSTDRFSMNSNIVGDSNHKISDSNSRIFYKTLTMDVKSLVESGIPFPNYLKVDVDGNEPDIINGADLILDNKSLKSILIEIDLEDQQGTSLIYKKFSKYGFKEKNRFDAMSKFDKKSHKKLFNVIFSR
jgi:FkbM family methyltransferase